MEDERRTPNVELRTSNVEPRTPDVQRTTFSVERSNVQRSTFSVGRSNLTLPFVDTEQMKRRVGSFSEDRPGVYRMLDEAGRVIYVGKAKRVRTRLMSYFRANSLENKQARILNATQDITWDYTPSEFAAYVRELREIKRHKPPFNVRMNRSRNVGFIKVSDGAAPKIHVGAARGAGDERVYGPFRSMGKLKESVRVLNLQLGLRDCAMNMPITYSEQADLFNAGRRAACLRHPLGTCTGPCGGFVSEADYRSRVDTAIAFLEGRTIEPLDRVVAAMTGASNASKYEEATRWRDRFDALEWLFAAGNRVRGAIDGLSFVYTDPGTYGDDRAYVVKRATIRASAPAPRTPIEISAFRSLVSEHVGQEGSAGPLPATAIDEMVLLLGWFRKHPAALGRTVALEEWLELNGE